jgi:predicted lipoprotein with Yx(FWY)xxD motif
MLGDLVGRLSAARSRVRAAPTAASVAVAVVVMGVAGCGGGGALGGTSGGSDGVVARVGGVAISRAALDHWVSLHTGRSDPALRERMLEFLIGGWWTIAEAGELGVRVSDEEAQKQLDVLDYGRREGIAYARYPVEVALQGAFVAARAGERLWLMRLGMLAAGIEQKLSLQARLAVTRGEIARFYKGHPRWFVVPERRDLQWLVSYSRTTVRLAIREVRSGKSFVRIAERVSLDPVRITGLELVGAREMQFARNVFAAKPHVLTGPFRQEQNYYLLKVTNVTPAHRLTLAQAEASILDRLAIRHRERAAGAVAEAFTRKWRPRTICATGYVVASCARYQGPAPQTSGSPYIQSDGIIPPAVRPASMGTRVSTKRVKQGRILAAGPKNLTVYLNQPDAPSASGCGSACERLWAPVKTTVAPTIGGLAIPADLGTITRSGGSKQVTYFHHPLYYYTKDTSSRDLKGQGVKSFGLRWYALSTIGVRFQPARP